MMRSSARNLGERPDILDGSPRPIITRWIVDGSRAIRLDYIWGDEDWGWGVVEDGRHTGWCGSPNLDRVLGQPGYYRSVSQALDAAERAAFKRLARLNEQISQEHIRLGKIHKAKMADYDHPARAPW